MKAKQTEMILAFVIIVLMAFFVFQRFLYQPAQNQIASLKKQQTELKKKLDSAMMDTRNLSEAEAKLEQLITVFQESKNKMALGEDQVTLVLQALADNAKSHNINITLIRPGQLEAIPEVTLKKLAIKVTFEGSYKNISDYLVSLEQLPARMIIQELHLNRNEKIAPNIEGNFTLVAIYEGRI